MTIDIGLLRRGIYPALRGSLQLRLSKKIPLLGGVRGGFNIILIC